MICWHKWSKWTKIGWGVREAVGDSLLTGANYSPEQRYTIGRFEEQRRECEKCGKSQVRRVET